jgi:uncharacterized LabA/DUF88 family protein
MVPLFNRRNINLPDQKIISKSLSNSLAPLATIVTFEMAAEIKHKKYQERMKKRKELAEIKLLEEEQERLRIVQRIYNQSMESINKWIYDEKDSEISFLYTPRHKKVICPDKILDSVVPMIQDSLGNSYKVYKDLYRIKVEIDQQKITKKEKQKIKNQ